MRERGISYYKNKEGHEFWFNKKKIKIADFIEMVKGSFDEEEILPYLQRNDGPAWVSEEVIGCVTLRSYHWNGVYHRLDGPAIINKAPHDEEYFINGIFIKPYEYDEAVEYYLANGPEAFKLRYHE